VRAALGGRRAHAPRPTADGVGTTDTAVVTNTPAGAPPDALSTLQQHWPELPWHSLHEAHGAFHHVLLLPPVAALRLRIGAGHEAATRREHRLAAVLSNAGLPVPRPLAEPVHTEHWSTAAVSLVEGASRDARNWTEDRAEILPLLETWGSVGSANRALAAELPAVRSWCGGARWPSLVETMTAQHPLVRDAARDRVRAVLDLESAAELSAVHGDFGPHNIVWSREGPVLIDTDHAAWADPAIDVAPLLGCYSRRELSADLPASLLERAAAHRRTLSLQVAAAAQLSGNRQLRDHALTNFARRIRSGDPQW
jgi:Ser/Thr protein kinase RdoA (MazF antagonist)